MKIVWCVLFVLAVPVVGVASYAFYLKHLQDVPPAPVPALPTPPVDSRPEKQALRVITSAPDQFIFDQVTLDGSPLKVEAGGARVTASLSASVEVVLERLRRPGVTPSMWFRLRSDKNILVDRILVQDSQFRGLLFKTRPAVSSLIANEFPIGVERQLTFVPNNSIEPGETLRCEIAMKVSPSDQVHHLYFEGEAPSSNCVTIYKSE